MPMYAVKRTDHSLPVPCIGIGHTVRLYMNGLVFSRTVKALGTTKGSPLYFQGVVKECVPGAVILRGRFALLHDSGRRSVQDCCRRFEMENVDRVEVVARVAE